MSTSPTTPTASPITTTSKLSDLEIKDAQLIFNAVWHDLESSIGIEQLRATLDIWLKEARVERATEQPAAETGEQTR